MGEGTRYIFGWGGAARPLIPCHSLRQKIADFPTLFKTEFRFLIPCLRHLTRNHTLCKTRINIESSSYLIHWQSQNYLQLDHRVTQAVYRPRKDTLFKTKIDKIDTLIKKACSRKRKHENKTGGNWGEEGRRSL